jgi:HYR domain/Secretion system C-terminal sorting domain
MKKTLTLIIVLFGTISTLFAQTNKPVLVKDINTGVGFPATSTRSSFIYGFTSFNNRTYFSAEPDSNDYRGNRRLFSLTNGTASPQLVPLNLGVEGRLAGQQKPHLMQNALFTVVRNSDTIYELWRNDGTTATFVDTISRYGRFTFNSTIGSVYDDKLFYSESYSKADNTTTTDLYRHSGVRESKQFIAKLYRQEYLPTGAFFQTAKEEVQKYFPMPDVTFADITFDSIGATPLRGIRRVMRAYDNTNGSSVDLFNIAWRGDYAVSSNRFTGYKVIGAVNSKLLFTSRESSTNENATKDTIFSFDRNGVRNIVQLNAGSPVRILNIGNRIVYLDVFNQIWETDGSSQGTRLLLPSGQPPISDIFYANGKVYYWLQSYLPNNRYLNRIMLVSGGEIGRFETTTRVSSGPVFWNNNKDLFVIAEMAQGDTINQKIFRIENSATPLRDLGLLSRCRVGSNTDLDSLCPCLYIPLSPEPSQFTVVDSSLLFVAGSVAYGQEVWRMNLGTSTPSNPCATDTIKPIFANCPSSITTSTSTTCVNVNWTAPTATDNCSTATLSTTHAPSFCFPIGTTTVVYTATDALNNRATCSFTVTITGTTAANCQKYAASQTNSICNPATYQPFFLRNTTDRYVPDGVEFKETSAGTATLKGTLRTATWQVVPIDLTFSGKSTTGTPSLINCLDPSVSTANWAYYSTVSGIISLPTGIFTVNSLTNALQIGTSANTQNVGELGGFAKISGRLAGQTTNATYDLAFKLGAPMSIACGVVSSNPCDSDAVKPIFTSIPSDITVSCSNFIPVASAPTATDNCTAQPTVVLTEINAGDSLLTRTWRATDAQGNFATSVQRIVIRDITAPTIANCPQNQTFTTTAACQIVTWTAPTVADDCAGTPTVTQTHNSGFCFPTGTTNVVYTAKDGRNNQKTCSFLVTINRQVSVCNAFSANTLAINNCPNNINVTAPTGSTCLAANWTPPTAVQTVGTTSIPVTLTTNFSPNYCFPIGSTNVVYTATDSCGNVKTCNFTVTVNPTVVAGTCKKYTVAGTNSICNPATWQPFLLRNGANRYIADVLEFKETNATTATLKGSLRDANWQLVPIDLTFSGKSASGTPQLINCLDPSVSAANWAYYSTVSGTISLPTGIITVNLATNALQIGTSANTQNVGELGGFAKIGNATTTFDLAFKLSAPVNVACDGGVAVNCATDSVPPVLSGIPANLTVDCFANAPPIATPTAADNCTANIRIQVVEVRGADYLQRTWTATDARGNAATGSQRITILDITAPVISNCPTTITANTTATCTTVTWTQPTATDACGTATLSPNLPLSTCFPIGTTPVTYTAMDAAGNAATCRFNVVVTNGTVSAGLDLSIVATPSEYRFWTPVNYRISLKNNGLAASNGIKIAFEPADLQVGGGAATASVGTFNEYCAGGTACREWTIPSLAAGAIATLDVPRFVLNPVGDLVSKAKLLTPSISEATVTVTSAANALNGGTARLSRPKLTQLVPVIIQDLSPNPTLSDLEIELESLTERDVVFQFSDLVGKVVQTETRHLAAGFQIKTFDVSALPQGVYFIQISTNRARNVPVKFVKL